MRKALHQNLLFVVFICLACGCSGGQDIVTPPVSDGHSNELTDSRDGGISGDGSSHNLMMFEMVYVDPVGPEWHIISSRHVTKHWNVLGWLEIDPCTDCFRINSIVPSGYGTLLIDIEITHPYASKNLTAFDVRGIPMFRGSKIFPASFMNISDRTLGDGELINPDGFTKLYNITTEGEGPNGLEGYQEGRYAGVETPNTLLNAYKRHITDDPANTRNALYAGDSVSVVYDVDIPGGPFIFGYAVDASWSQPDNIPVIDPMIDFPRDANCAEAWQISVFETPVLDGLTDCGGKTKLTIDVYDWQDQYGIWNAVVECPELFSGRKNSYAFATHPDFQRYTVTIENTNQAGVGEYSCLIVKQDDENDPDNKPWLDLTAYQVVTIEVGEFEALPPVAVVDALSVAPVNTGINFDGRDSFDNDCGGEIIVLWEWDWENDGVYDEEGDDVDHMWTEEGVYYVQLRVTDDEGVTDILDEPFEVTITETWPPVAYADAYPTPSFVGEEILFRDHGSYDRDNEIVKYEWDWENDGIYDEEAIETTHSWGSAGTYYVQFRVTDETDLTGELDEPIEIVIHESNPLTITDVTPDWLNINPFDIAMSGNYAIIASGGFGINIMDMTDPENPVWVNRVDIGHSAKYVVVSDGYAYVDNRQYYSPSPVTVIDIDPVESAHKVAEIDFPDRGVSMFLINEGYMYAISSDPDLFVVINVRTPESPEFVLSFEISDIGGSLFYENGIVYLGSSESVLFIDVSDPESAHIVDTAPVRLFSPFVVKDGYGFMTRSGGPFGWDSMEVYDIDPPDEAHEVLSIGCPAAAKMVLRGNYIHLIGSSYYAIADISHPESTFVVGDYRKEYGHSEKFDIFGDYAYLGNQGLGLLILDISDVENPVLVNTIASPGGARDAYVSDGIMYVASDWAGLQIWDVQDIGSVSFITQAPSKGNPGRTNVDNGYAFVTGHGGIRVTDVDPVSSAHHVIDLGVASSYQDIPIQNGYAYTADFSHNLNITDIDPVESGHLINSVAVYRGMDVAIEGDYAYVADHNGGLVIVDISEPGFESIVNTLVTSGAAFEVEVRDGIAYVGVSLGGNALDIFDVDPPEAAYMVSSVDLPGDLQDLDLYGSYALVGSRNAGLQIVDIDPPETAFVLTEYRGEIQIHRVHVDGNFAYLSGHSISNAGTGVIILKLQ